MATASRSKINKNADGTKTFVIHSHDIEPSQEMEIRRWITRAQTKGLKRGDKVIVSDSVPARLRCGIGHEYNGSFAMTKELGFDMDGDPFWYRPAQTYDPETCIVCGLRTYKVIAASEVPIIMEGDDDGD